MRKFPKPIEEVIHSLTRLPGVGPKTALRYAFALLRLSPQERSRFAAALENLKFIKTCEQCFKLSEEARCSICSDERRNKQLLCVVADSRDVSTIDATNVFNGHYFVLGGTLNPIEGHTPDTLNMAALLRHIEARPELEEIILGFSPDVHGETTIMYLTRQLKRFNIKTSRLARGLPIGADIEYADEVTLGDALLGRRET
jgi:recombination protein RecR